MVEKSRETLGVVPHEDGKQLKLYSIKLSEYICNTITKLPKSNELLEGCHSYIKANLIRVVKNTEVFENFFCDLKSIAQYEDLFNAEEFFSMQKLAKDMVNLLNLSAQHTKNVVEKDAIFTKNHFNIPELNVKILIDAEVCMKDSGIYDMDDISEIQSELLSEACSFISAVPYAFEACEV